MRVCVVFAFAMCGLVSVASAQIRDYHQVVLREYNAYGASARIEQASRAAVIDLFEHADITVRWRNCSIRADRRSALEPCQEPLGLRELVIRIVSAPRRIVDRTMLGYSDVNVSERRGTLATIFADRVSELAHRRSIDEGTLLGRAIAHEVGHLLMGTTTHSLRGLMRSLWAGPRRDRPEDWTFSDDEVDAIREGLDNRGAVANAALLLR